MPTDSADKSPDRKLTERHRRPILSRSSSVADLDHPVTDASNSLDRLGSKWLIDLASQITGIHLGDV